MITWGTRMAILLAILVFSAGSGVTQAADRIPYTFFLTHYELLGDPNRPTGVRYHSSGRPFAKAPNGSVITLDGKGAWDPYRNRVVGSGQYSIKDAKGKVRAQGAWRVTRFVSFEQRMGWWEPGFTESGWQGPPGSVSFSGFLTVAVRLDRLGKGVLLLWCLMPTVRMPGDHKGDGLMLVGPGFNFTGYHDSEMSAEGVMFYSTDLRSKGYALNAQRTAFLTSPRR